MDARRTETFVAPVDALRDFIFIFYERAVWGVSAGGGAANVFLYFPFPCSAGRK